MSYQHCHHENVGLWQIQPFFLFSPLICYSLSELVQTWHCEIAAFFLQKNPYHSDHWIKFCFSLERIRFITRVVELLFRNCEGPWRSDGRWHLSDLKEIFEEKCFCQKNEVFCCFWILFVSGSVWSETRLSAVVLGRLKISAVRKQRKSTSQIAKGTTQRLNTWNTHNLIKILGMRKYMKIWKYDGENSDRLGPNLSDNAWQLHRMSNLWMNCISDRQGHDWWLSLSKF